MAKTFSEAGSVGDYAHVIKVDPDTDSTPGTESETVSLTFDSESPDTLHEVDVDVFETPPTSVGLETLGAIFDLKAPCEGDPSGTSDPDSDGDGICDSYEDLDNYQGLKVRFYNTTHITGI